MIFHAATGVRDPFLTHAADLAQTPRINTLTKARTYAALCGTLVTFDWPLFLVSKTDISCPRCQRSRKWNA